MNENVLEQSEIVPSERQYSELNLQYKLSNQIHC